MSGCAVGHLENGQSGRFFPFTQEVVIVFSHVDVYSWYTACSNHGLFIYSVNSTDGTQQLERSYCLRFFYGLWTTRHEMLSSRDRQFLVSVVSHNHFKGNHKPQTCYGALSKNRAHVLQVFHARFESRRLGLG